MPDVTPFSAVRTACGELRGCFAEMEAPTTARLLRGLQDAVDLIDRLAAMCEAFEKQTTALIPDLAMTAGGIEGVKLRMDGLERRLKEQEAGAGQAKREAFVDRLAASMGASARKEFSESYRRVLLLTMERCGMTEYPPEKGELDYDRASGDMVCSMCDCTYHEHPLDWRVIGYGNVPCLVVLCDGRRVKL